ncbi:MAG TPA: lasso RiPP family leader peptide-containing protein [Polyangiaceae bacterium]|nr:lasso RiPP family leader peptide-containing protein [Polyangiaceae bacterium]
MSEEKSATSVALANEPVQAPVRKPYSTPQLTELGTLAQLTKGGDQEQRGEGPGFSL